MSGIVSASVLMCERDFFKKDAIMEDAILSSIELLARMAKKMRTDDAKNAYISTIKDNIKELEKIKKIVDR